MSTQRSFAPLDAELEFKWKGITDPPQNRRLPWPVLKAIVRLHDTLCETDDHLELSDVCKFNRQIEAIIRCVATIDAYPGRGLTETLREQAPERARSPIVSTISVHRAKLRRLADNRT
jgi:hypothetical protein